MDGGSKNCYAAVDIVKFIMCMFVVSFHTNVGEMLDGTCISGFYNLIIGRMPVEFFFMAAGFLLFGKIQFPFALKGSDGKRVFKYLKRIFICYFGWKFIYALANVLFFKWNLREAVKTLLPGNNGYGIQFWYLEALFVAVALTALLMAMHVRIENILLLAVIFMGIVKSVDLNMALFGMGYGEASSVINMQNHARAVLYILLGAFISQRNIKVDAGFALAGAGLIAAFYTVICTRFNTEFWYAAINVIIFVLCIQIKVPERKLFFNIRKISEIIFYLHMLPNVFYSKVFGLPVLSWMHFVFVFAVSFAVALAYIVLREKLEPGVRTAVQRIKGICRNIG